MRGMYAMVRGVLLVGLLLFGSISVATAHTDLEQQIAALSEQLQSNPGNAELLLQRGDLYRRHMEYVAAEQDFTQARLADPDNRLIDFYEGRLSLETGKPEKAVGFLREYLETDPETASAWVLLGRAELELEAPNRAAEDFSRAIDLSARPAPDLYRLLALSLLADNRPADALRAVDAGLDRIPGEVNLLGLGIDISLAVQQPVAAQGYLTQLPEGLLRVKRWGRRAELTTCLTNENESVLNQCLVDVNSNLQEQLVGLTSGR